MVRSCRVAHCSPFFPFSSSYVRSWSETTEPTPPPFCFLCFCLPLFFSTPAMYRWPSPEPRGGSWFWWDTSFFTARLSLIVGGVISRGRGWSEDNGFGIFLHIELLSIYQSSFLLRAPKPESHGIWCHGPSDSTSLVVARIRIWFQAFCLFGHPQHLLLLRSTGLWSSLVFSVVFLLGVFIFLLLLFLFLLLLLLLPSL